MQKVKKVFGIILTATVTAMVALSTQIVLVF